MKRRLIITANIAQDEWLIQFSDDSGNSYFHKTNQDNLIMFCNLFGINISDYLNWEEIREEVFQKEFVMIF